MIIPTVERQLFDWWFVLKKKIALKRNAPKNIFYSELQEVGLLKFVEY